jgi:hypothetical protein
MFFRNDFAGDVELPHGNALVGLLLPNDLFKFRKCRVKSQSEFSCNPGGHPDPAAFPYFQFLLRKLVNGPETVHFPSFLFKLISSREPRKLRLMLHLFQPLIISQSDFVAFQFHPTKAVIRQIRTLPGRLGKLWA